MSNYNFNDLFPERKKTTPKKNVKSDIVIKLIGGADRYRIEFLFYNKANAIAKEWEFVRISTLSVKNCNRIYFLPLRSSLGKFDYKVKKTSISCSFALTPTKEEERKYRNYWVNGGYDIRQDNNLEGYDGDCGLYYIELPRMEEFHFKED